MMRARIFSVVSFIASSVLLLALGGKWLMPDQPRVFAWNAPAPTWATADAENVELVGHIGGRTYAVAVQGNYAYIGEGPKLTILDISDPTSPVVIGKTALLPDVVLGVAVAAGAPQGHTYAYVVVGGAGLGVVDVSSPSNPTEVGFYDTPGQAEGEAVN